MTSENTQKGISGSTLKLIAIITMLIDHIGAALVAPLISTHPELMNFYYVLRLLGRIAFPIFCFLLVEGFFHTRNIPKYALRLAAFALISEIPFDLAMHQTVFYRDGQNVFFTLLIGLLTIWGLQYITSIFPQKKGLQVLFRALILIAGMLAACALKTDYNLYGVIIIAVLYENYQRRDFSTIISCFLLCLMNILECTSFAAVPLIRHYNGKRGLSLKYFFYVFYPAHLLILYLIGQIISILPTF